MTVYAWVGILKMLKVIAKNVKSVVEFAQQPLIVKDVLKDINLILYLTVLYVLLNVLIVLLILMNVQGV